MDNDDDDDVSPYLEGIIDNRYNICVVVVEVSNNPGFYDSVIGPGINSPSAHSPIPNKRTRKKYSPL
jgi:hypothetical protein